jgi:DNA-binding HxlR family transcriptional regulator
MSGTVVTRSARNKRALASTYPARKAKPASSQQERAACPLYTAIAVIEGRWKPMLFQRLSARAHGFGELRRAMPGVASKVLREQLRQMQADGLVARRELGPAPAGVKYRLTPYGRTLAPVFQTLWQWGTRHLARRDAHNGTFVSPPMTAVTRGGAAATLSR